MIRGNFRDSGIAFFDAFGESACLLLVIIHINSCYFCY